MAPQHAGRRTEMTYTLQTDRDKDILRNLVEHHVSTGQPVGSKSIASQGPLAVSSATVRNAMVNLEDAGYITRPHPSAGGVPTDKGYRYYVDTLLRVRPINKRDRERIHLELENDWLSVQELLSHTAYILGMVCREVGVALAPRLYDGRFERVELISVAHRKVLLVLSLTSGLVRSIVAELEADIPAERLADASRFLNERLSGCSLREIKGQIDERLEDAPQSRKKIVQLFVQYSNYLFDFEENEKTHIGGTTYIVSQPEFVTDYTKLSSILEFLEHKRTVAHWLSERSHGNRIAVTIGRENGQDEMQSCSVVTSTYGIGDVRGVIGVIGPTRMPYARLMSVVGYTARYLNTMFA